MTLPYQITKHLQIDQKLWFFVKQLWSKWSSVMFISSLLIPRRKNSGFHVPTIEKLLRTATHLFVKSNWSSMFCTLSKTCFHPKVTRTPWRDPCFTFAWVTKYLLAPTILTEPSRTPWLKVPEICWTLVNLQLPLRHIFLLVATVKTAEPWNWPSSSSDPAYSNSWNFSSTYFPLMMAGPFYWNC